MPNPLQNEGKGILNKLSQPLGKIPKGEVFGFAIGAGLDMMDSVSQGRGVGESAFKAVASGVMWNMIGGGTATALMLAPVVPALASAVLAKNDQLASQHRMNRDPGNLNFSYTDTQQALTMRQAAVQAIQGSKMNARSALGGEARLMHRGVPTRWG
jgi:hypothetical protein